MAGDVYQQKGKKWTPRSSCDC